MPNKIMLVTVGTSLYHSASWKADVKPLSEIRGYSRWVRDPYLEDPSLRSAMVEGECGSETGVAVKAKLEELLTNDNAEEWAGYLEDDKDHPLRYSAELTTILKLFSMEGTNFRYLAGFLSDKYEQIRFLTDEDEKDPGRIASDHLLVYLLRLATGTKTAVVPKPDISGPDLEGKAKSFYSFLLSISAQFKEREFDLVLTGGYKLYAMMASQFLEMLVSKFAEKSAKPPEWRIIYLHEDKNELVRLLVGVHEDLIQVEDRPKVKMGKHLSQP